MNLLERFGWWIVAMGSGRWAHCSIGHILPSDTFACTFCYKFCYDCNSWWSRKVIHWPHRDVKKYWDGDT